MRRNGKRSYQKTDREDPGSRSSSCFRCIEESARKAAEICGAKVYADSKELINAENVDAVFIVSPGFAHVDSLLQAIEAGKRIFCEKPLCTTAEDCLKVVKAEEAAGKHLIQLGFMRRYDKGYQQIKEALATGEYGEPLILHCTHRIRR